MNLLYCIITKTNDMRKLTLIFFLITALSFSQEQEKKEAPWNVMYPEFMAEEAAKYFEEFNKLWSDESPINAKEGRLVAIAVSAAIRCEYCIAAQIEFAKKDGANDEEIKAAIQIAAEIQRFSTLLYGNEFDVDTFNKIIGRENKE